MKFIVVSLALVVLLLSVGIESWESQSSASKAWTAEKFYLPDAPNRTYVIYRPKQIDPKKTYWLVVAVHWLDGRAEDMGSAFFPAVKSAHFDCILMAPQMNNKDYQIPWCGESAVAEAMIESVQRQYKTHPKVLLVGFSGGAQFAHRFALQQAPEKVQACAALSAGTWTAPDGRFIDSSASGTSGSSVLTPAKDGTKSVAFLVSCGRKDTARLGAAHEFAGSLKQSGYHSEELWPNAGHNLCPESINGTMKFFARQVKEKH